MVRSPSKLKPWAEAIERTRKVVLTDSEWSGEIGKGAVPKRTSYIAVFDISNLKLEGEGEQHSFTLDTRYKSKESK